MAGHSSDEEENYWPGYVDALTTMTMVLTFIMMVLGVVVFTLAQNVSKTVFQAVADAAQIDTSAMNTKNPVEFQKEILSALAARNADSKFDSMANFDAEDKHLNAGAPNVAVLPPGPEADQRTAIKEEAPIDRQVLQNTQTAEKKVSRVGGIVNGTVDGLQIEFLNGGVTLGEPETLALKKYIAKNKSANFAIESLVVLDHALQSGGATEGRRRAYYRAMLVRQQMISEGLPADRISLLIRDANGDVKIDTINITSKIKVQ